MSALESAVVVADSRVLNKDVSLEQRVELPGVEQFVAHSTDLRPLKPIGTGPIRSSAIASVVKMKQVKGHRGVAAILTLGTLALGAAGCGGVAHESTTTRPRAVHASRPSATTANPSAPVGGASTHSDAATPSGQAMPTGDIPGWHQVFADNFAKVVPLGSFPGAVAPRWGHSYPDWWKDTTKHGVYMPTEVISIAKGVMNVYVHTQGGIHLVAAPVPTIAGAQGAEGGLLYGRFVIRIRTDVVPGYKAAMLLWPDSETWPRDGEIDFPEAQLGGTIDGFVHNQNGASKDDQTIFTTTAAYTQWHTATVTWLPHEITFQLDNQIVGIVTRRIPDTPMHLVIQIETQTNAPAPSNAAAGYVQIGWLTVYTPACNPLMSVVLTAAACTG